MQKNLTELENFSFEKTARGGTRQQGVPMSEKIKKEG